jgi:hypothetical protein
MMIYRGCPFIPKSCDSYFALVSVLSPHLCLSMAPCALSLCPRGHRSYSLHRISLPVRLSCYSRSLRTRGPRRITSQVRTLRYWATGSYFSVCIKDLCSVKSKGKQPSVLELLRALFLLRALQAFAQSPARLTPRVCTRVTAFSHTNSLALAAARIQVIIAILGVDSPGPAKI